MTNKDEYLNSELHKVRLQIIAIEDEFAPELDKRTLSELSGGKYSRLIRQANQLILEKSEAAKNG